MYSKSSNSIITGSPDPVRLYLPSHMSCVKAPAQWHSPALKVAGSPCWLTSKAWRHQKEAKPQGRGPHCWPLLTTLAPHMCPQSVALCRSPDDAVCVFPISGLGRRPPSQGLMLAGQMRQLSENAMLHHMQPADAHEAGLKAAGLRCACALVASCVQHH